MTELHICEILRQIGLARIRTRRRGTGLGCGGKFRDVTVLDREECLVAPVIGAGQVELGVDKKMTFLHQGNPLR